MTSNSMRRKVRPPKRAEYSFREGFGALEQGRIKAAVTHLANAARLEPQVARYRAYFGRALAAEEQTRRLAENEIQSAVKLEPDNATFRTMLAELYFDLKFHRRAQTELDRALAIDPNSATGSRPVAQTAKVEQGRLKVRRNLKRGAVASEGGR